MPRLLFIALALTAWFAISFAAPAYTANKVAVAKCGTPVYHQFDFWLGDWDTFDHDALGQPSTARNHVDTILDGCALREDYAQFDGLRGQSFTIYDAARKVWHQSWVTNRGGLLVLEGKLQGDRIVLNGVDHADNNAMLRVSWEAQPPDVREIATKSRDDGAHWQPVFDIVFRPHLSKNKPTESLRCGG